MSDPFDKQAHGDGGRHEMGQQSDMPQLLQDHEMDMPTQLDECPFELFINYDELDNQHPPADAPTPAQPTPSSGVSPFPHFPTVEEYRNGAFYPTVEEHRNGAFDMTPGSSSSSGNNVAFPGTYSDASSSIMPGSSPYAVNDAIPFQGYSNAMPATTFGMSPYPFTFANNNGQFVPVGGHSNGMFATASGHSSYTNNNVASEGGKGSDHINAVSSNKRPLPSSFNNGVSVGDQSSGMTSTAPSPYTTDTPDIVSPDNNTSKPDPKGKGKAVAPSQDNEEYIPNLGADDDNAWKDVAEPPKKKKTKKDGTARKVRQPRSGLCRWGPPDVIRALLGIVYACGEHHVPIPFEMAAKQVHARCTASALQQAILKMHTKLNQCGGNFPKVKMSWPKKVEIKIKKVPMVDHGTQYDFGDAANQTGFVPGNNISADMQAQQAQLPSCPNMSNAATTGPVIAAMPAAPVNPASNFNFVPVSDTLSFQAQQLPGPINAGPTGFSYNQGPSTPIQNEELPNCPPAPRRLMADRMDISNIQSTPVTNVAGQGPFHATQDLHFPANAQGELGMLDAFNDMLGSDNTHGDQGLGDEWFPTNLDFDPMSSEPRFHGSFLNPAPVHQPDFPNSLRSPCPFTMNGHNNMSAYNGGAFNNSAGYMAAHGPIDPNLTFNAQTPSMNAHRQVIQMSHRPSGSGATRTVGSFPLSQESRPQMNQAFDSIEDPFTSNSGAALQPPYTSSGPSNTSYRPYTSSGPSNTSYRPSTSSGPSNTSYRPSTSSGPSNTSYRSSTSNGPSHTGYGPSTSSGPSHTGYGPSTSNGTSHTGYGPFAFGGGFDMGPSSSSK